MLDLEHQHRFRSSLSGEVEMKQTGIITPAMQTECVSLASSPKRKGNSESQEGTIVKFSSLSGGTSGGKVKIAKSGFSGGKLRPRSE